MAHIDVSKFNNTFALSGSPMVVRVHDFQFGRNADGTPSLFRQVMVEVTAYYDSILTDSNKRVFQFPVPVEVGASDVVCDISSAIRSSLAKYQYSTDGVAKNGNITYPNCAFIIRAWERELIDGELKEHSPVQYPSESSLLHAGLGGMSQYERWKNSSVNQTFSFSTKPTTGEIFANGQIVCSSALNGSSVKTTFSEASANIDSRERTVFLFVNSRGVFETVSALPRQSLGYGISSERKQLSQSPSYAPSPVITTHKEGGGAVWQMSSGYVDADWADWFASEFLMAKRYWLWHDGRWLPVAVEPDGDTVMVYDLNDPSLLAVNFTVRSALNGSIR